MSSNISRCMDAIKYKIIKKRSMKRVTKSVIGSRDSVLKTWLMVSSKSDSTKKDIRPNSHANLILFKKKIHSAFLTRSSSLIILLQPFTQTPFLYLIMHPRETFMLVLFSTSLTLSLRQDDDNFSQEVIRLSLVLEYV